MDELKVRLAHVTSIFRWFLLIIGIPVLNNEKSENWHCLKRFWRRFCYLIALQAHVYIFIQRSYRYLDFSMIVHLDALMAIAGRLNRLVSNMLLHTFLAFNLEDIFITFCRKVETAYVFLNRPHLDSLLAFAAVGTLWTFWAVKHIMQPVYSKKNSKY
jgi:hypothetical protein